MARQRRGGFRPELRGTLGTLLRTTLAQAGVVRDALERGAREGRSRLDDALATRRRTDALADLGEIVLDLVRRGEIDLGELPEARDIVDHLDSLDAGHPVEHDEPVARAPVRKRFDKRDEADGTVSARTWAPKKVAAPQRVWRPPADVVAEPPPPPKPRGKKKGGITFGNDDAGDTDLADYMHPDDVPKKT
jgi:hypothetical protein